MIVVVAAAMAMPTPVPLTVAAARVEANSRFHTVHLQAAVRRPPRHVVSLVANSLWASHAILKICPKCPGQRVQGLQEAKRCTQLDTFDKNDTHP